MNAALLDGSDPHWNSEIERIGVQVDAAHNPALFPYHFLHATLSKIGGYLAIFAENDRRVGLGFLFPRHLSFNGTPARRTYTLRYHAYPGCTVQNEEVVDACVAALGGEQVVFFDPLGLLTYFSTHRQIGNVDIGRPDADEALGTRALQQQIWDSPPEFLYPTDIYSAEFCAGTALVARVEGRLAGFLFGFYKFGGALLPADWQTRFRGDFRLESQTLGILPAYRALRIANLLKTCQAEQAWQEGIGIVNWTTDPLQYPNAALNFGRLRAITFEFMPNLYPFRNKLNRVHASRFGLTWLVGSQRVREASRVGARAEVIDLSRRPQIARVNDGCRHASFGLTADVVAVEIPADWTALQQDDIDQALAWRALTDEIFRHYVGLEPGQYAVTSVGADDARRYLIAERVDDSLWERLAREE